MPGLVVGSTVRAARRSYRMEDFLLCAARPPRRVRCREGEPALAAAVSL